MFPFQNRVSSHIINIEFPFHNVRNFKETLSWPQLMWLVEITNGCKCAHKNATFPSVTRSGSFKSEQNKCPLHVPQPHTYSVIHSLADSNLKVKCAVSAIVQEQQHLLVSVLNTRFMQIFINFQNNNFFFLTSSIPGPGK